MANETKFEIKGNFFLVTNITTGQEYIRENPSQVKFKRFKLDGDKFVLYSNTALSNDESILNRYILGGNSTAFYYTSSVKSSGIPFSSAEELEDWLSYNLGSDSNLGGDILKNRIVVNQNNVSTTLGGNIDSSKEYFIDGVVDMQGVNITVPSGGIKIKGYDFDSSGLVETSNSYSMMNSAVGGSGNILIVDLFIEVSGSDSSVYNLTDVNGFSAYEISRVNFNNCSSLGQLAGYRQGFESGTGRFGGKPELTLSGTWLGGYFIDSSIVRGLTDGNYSLFSAGVGFVMNSRFRSNQNIDLPDLVSFFDFSSSNFPNPSTIQINDAIISRNGVFDTSDNNITPNVSKSDLSSNWTGNVGIKNTFVGGKLTVSSEVTTTISTVNTWVTLDAVWSASSLEHFDSPVQGQLRHLGVSPTEYDISTDFIIESNANDDISIRFRRWDSKNSVFVDYKEYMRQVTPLAGPRDIAIFNMSTNIEMNQNDYGFFQVKNNTGANDVILEIDSEYIIESR